MTKSIYELWLASCSGDMETLKEYFSNGGMLNRRYNKFGKNHSLIAGAYRNGNIETVEYLLNIGESIEEDEQQEMTEFFNSRKIKRMEILLFNALSIIQENEDDTKFAEILKNEIGMTEQEIEDYTNF
ncbi:MAG: hypothetical protein II304_08885 [Bacteroidales bacterium]|nr:hypothetical protein [Bacteroidales bacterium]